MIKVNKRPFADIRECVLFVNNVSNEAAKELYDETITSISSLGTFPNAYPDIEGLGIGGTSIKRMPVHRGRYLVLYKVETDEVTIYDVIDSKKDNSILKL